MDILSKAGIAKPDQFIKQLPDKRTASLIITAVGNPNTPLRSIQSYLTINPNDSPATKTTKLLIAREVLAKPASKDVRPSQAWFTNIDEFAKFYVNNWDANAVSTYNKYLGELFYRIGQKVSREVKGPQTIGNIIT